MATFSERISELILEKEISSQDLATIAGVARFTINRWKQGKVHLYLSHAISSAISLKHSVEDIGDKYSLLFDKLRPVSKRNSMRIRRAVLSSG